MWLLNSTPCSVSLRKLRQAHHLIAAAVGEDRTLPTHELMQSAEPRHPLRAGPQHQVVGVAKNDVRTKSRAPLSGFIALTVAAVPTGMKAGVRMSPRCMRNRAGARLAIRCVKCEFETRGHSLKRHPVLKMKAMIAVHSARKPSVRPSETQIETSDVP